MNTCNYSWFDEPEPNTPWLVHGLIPADGYTSVVGKPKAGKSSAVRNLAVAVLKGREFLGRAMLIPPGEGRVLYLQLDRKDRPGRVSSQFRSLGVTREESSRLVMRLGEHLPAGNFEERLKWLAAEVKSAKPDLIVIDLFWQFASVGNTNEYAASLNAINQLQDALTAIPFKGAVVAVMHGRKATNPNDPFDDVLGSTSQRGSFSTTLMCTQHKKEQLRTIASDQTDKDDRLGEIPETIVIQNPDGTLALEAPISELEQAKKHSKSEEDLKKLLTFIDRNPGSDMDTILRGLGMSRKHALVLFRNADGLIHRTGDGIKGSPHRYYSGEQVPTESRNQ